jgi:DNA-binding transcriptional LysR family regulator
MHNQCTFNAPDALTTMNLNQLEHLLALDETRHFAKAASKVHLSQPAFSRSIQALEKQTGLVLFERKGGEIRPSPAGQFLIERARALLLESRSLQRDLHLFQRGEVGELAFGVGPFPSATLAGHAIQAIRQLYPEVSIRTETGNQTRLLSLLLKEEIEFFVADTREIPEAPYLTIETLMRQYGHLFARAGHPLAKGAHRFAAAWRYGVASVKLADELKVKLGRLLGHSDRSPPRFAVECDDANLLHQVALRTDTLVASTDLAAKPWLQSGELVALNITDFPKIFANVSIVSLSNRTLSPVALHAMEQFRKQQIRIG